MLNSWNIFVILMINKVKYFQVFISLIIAICLFHFIFNILKLNEVFPVDVFTPLIKIISLVSF